MPPVRDRVENTALFQAIRSVKTGEGISRRTGLIAAAEGVGALGGATALGYGIYRGASGIISFFDRTRTLTPPTIRNIEIHPVSTIQDADLALDINTQIGKTVLLHVSPNGFSTSGQTESTSGNLSLIVVSSTDTKSLTAFGTTLDPKNYLLLTTRDYLGEVQQQDGRLQQVTIRELTQLQTTYETIGNVRYHDQLDTSHSPNIIFQLRNALQTERDREAFRQNGIDVITFILGSQIEGVDIASEIIVIAKPTPEQLQDGEQIRQMRNNHPHITQ